MTAASASASASASSTERPDIDLAFRPGSYFWPIDHTKHVLGRVKGTQRRRMLEAAAGQPVRYPGLEEFSRPSLSEPLRAATGRLHPRMMGGEYLPDAVGEELEIARIDIESTTCDATSLYARLGRSRIHYRMVDEYGGDTLEGRVARTSIQPLSLGAMTAFFIGAWDLMQVLECNFDSDVAGMLGFFRGSSPFYPDFDRLLRRHVVEHMRRQTELHR